MRFMLVKVRGPSSVTPDPWSVVVALQVGQVLYS